MKAIAALALVALLAFAVPAVAVAAPENASEEEVQRAQRDTTPGASAEAVQDSAENEQEAGVQAQSQDGASAGSDGSSSEGGAIIPGAENVGGEADGADAPAADGGEGSSGTDGDGSGNSSGSNEGDGSAEGEGDQDAPEVDPNNRVNPQQMPDSSFLYDTSIADLATADPYMNNQTVQVVGEAIGDIIDAVDGPQYVWVMLQERVDNDYPQVSVIMTRDQAGLIDQLGQYGVRGTTLQVRGTFHLACPEHDGLSDLHAVDVTVVSRGAQNLPALDMEQFIPGAVLFVVAIVLLLVYRRLQEGQR